MEMPVVREEEEADVVWGATAIGKLICRGTRSTFNLLETGQLSGARKVGGRWCITRRALMQNVEALALPLGLRDLAKHLTPEERKAFFGEMVI